ncbi:MAG: DNA-formamidopyrimidine glycosylase [Mycoplasmataceae bacterium]|jgi:formamidopyrimidine-DNA glycosylase|nr:DNA-formamidopyrimidine glycosylase [Mycoplasmataceae bacterium]
MPELPEVQTIINTLSSKGLIGKEIKSIDVFVPKIIKNTNPAGLNTFLKGEVFKKIERIGKYIVMHFSHDKILLIHLRMEGKLFYIVNTEESDKKHLRIKINLSDGCSLLYYDSRMFGTFHIYKENDYRKSKEISKIAIDPLSKEFTYIFLKNKIHSKNTPIKSLLLDQSNVSGIGNIYADEILYKAGVSPYEKGKNVTDEQIKLIVKYSKDILTKAISLGGTTIFSYKSDKNTSGHYQGKLQVHGREGEPCFKCKTKIVKVFINGRGTYYCPKCQKLSKK